MVGALLLTVALSGGCARKEVVPYDQARAQRETAKSHADSGQELPPVGQRPGQPPLTGPVSVRQPSSGAATPPMSILRPSLGFIEERRARFEKTLSDWHTLDQQLATLPTAQDKRRAMDHCSGELRELVSKYRALAENLAGRGALSAEDLAASEIFLETQRRDIRFLEGPCLPFLTAGAEQFNVRPSATVALMQAEAAMQEAMQRGDYAAVVSAYEGMSLPPGKTAGVAAVQSYVQALMRLQRDDQALAALRELLRRQHDEGILPREFQLMRLLGDLLLTQEKYGEAREQYRELARVHGELGAQVEWANRQLILLGTGEAGEEVRAYAALQRRIMGFDPARDGFRVLRQAEEFLQRYPYSPVLEQVKALLEEQRGQAQLWFDDLLARADRLAAEKRHREAVVLLENLPKDILPPPQQDMVRTKIEAITMAEAVGMETARLSVEQESQEGWNSALANFESGRYDEAITGFKKLLDTKYGERARARIDEAARLGAQEDRRRAAELFIRAGRTQDQEGKKKLLLASRKLLKDIPVKYPQSDLLDKVEGNLKRIEEEIVRIDPALLKAPVPAVDLMEPPSGPLPPPAVEGLNGFERP
ncbi:MAG: hypothetical protein BWK76_07595 [Desulfobulbaceae bacterium A2]|nr:MAG: hypothetical protein BWK76_07595 [Desulfobulbaceae bacterium A2]